MTNNNNKSFNNNQYIYQNIYHNNDLKIVHFQIILMQDLISAEEAEQMRNKLLSLDIAYKLIRTHILK